MATTPHAKRRYRILRALGASAKEATSVSRGSEIRYIDMLRKLVGLDSIGDLLLSQYDREGVSKAQDQTSRENYD